VVEHRAPAVFSIPGHRPFSDTLVEGILAQTGGKAEALVRGVILVPNNRAAMAIQAAFVRKSQNGLLLPRMIAIGDHDIGERVGIAFDPIDAEAIPPSIDPLHRQFILARLLQHTMSVERMARLDGAQAMRLAAELGQVIDQLIVERKTPADLRRVDVSGLSEHWEKSLALLTIILDDWPRECQRLGVIDLADRRNRQIDRVTEAWRTNAPAGPIWAAGISTAAPAVADLLRQVSRMERGQVIFAGLDQFMPNEEWESLIDAETGRANESHPQFHLRLLLDAIGVARASVLPWPEGRPEGRDVQGSKADAEREKRAEGVSGAMAPAQFTKRWAGLSDAERRLIGVTALELATVAEEAQAIALALRHGIEEPGQTAALVTPDRELARRVSAYLKRWGITADDSAGRPLSTTLPGTLLCAVSQALATHFDPVALLVLLKHPLVMSGEGRLEWLDGVRRLDLALRGPRPAAHLAGIDAYLAQSDRRTAKMKAQAATWWPKARDMLAPAEAGCTGEISLTSLIRTLRETVSALAGDAAWSGQDGRAVAELLSSMEALGDDGPTDVSLSAFALMLKDQLDAVALRPAFGGHPRIFIWGLLEAKLQSANLMILAGLNEGVWPKLANADPWLSPAIRHQLKLPSLERRIGLSAHDLASALGAEDVLITRAKRDTRAPTIASRFWLRLETYGNGFDLPKIRYDAIARQLDHGEGEKEKRPAPSPPVAERPRSISVTQVDGLKADPYAFYAQKMLRLSRLDAPGEEPDARWRGTFLHKVLGDWGQHDNFAPGTLLPRLAAAFDASGLHAVVRAMWQPRFEEAATWFEARVAEGRLEGRVPIAAEIEGKFDVAGVRLSGVADRIDRMPDGKLAIVDYKTGEAPSDKRVKEGYAVQLGLLGFLAEAGAFDGVEGTAEAYEYWSQKRAKDGKYGTASSPTSGRGQNKSDPESFAADMFAHFEQAVDAWLLGDEPFHAKLKPDFAFSDYDHLMRYDEWQGRDG
jgi:ATP-dependent helicase/nuclease subunit B